MNNGEHLAHDLRVETAQINRSVFIGNFSRGYAAALDIFGNSSGNSWVVNSLFARNRTPITAAGINMHGHHPGSSLEIIHSTFASPTLTTQGAVSVGGGSVFITNTIIASYTVGIERTDGMVSEDYNLFFANTTNLSGTITSGGHSLSGDDPLFIHPPTDDYHLATGSAAVDTGFDIGIADDFDGALRPQGANVDIGAYELLQPLLAITKTVQLSNIPVQPSSPLTYTIVVANQGAVNATNVVITDTLPTYIDGLDLNQTVDITAGESITFTLNVTLSNSVPFGEVITNTAFFSHTFDSGQDSKVFSVKEAEKAYLPVILKNSG